MIKYFLWKRELYKSKNMDCTIARCLKSFLSAVTGTGLIFPLDQFCDKHTKSNCKLQFCCQ